MRATRQAEERLFRIDILFPDGHEEPSSRPCLEEHLAKMFIATFNRGTGITGMRAIGREVELPCLKGDGACQLE